MKKIRKLTTLCIISALLILFFGGTVNAITPMDTYACSRGVNVYYYIESGSNNTFYQRIKDAAYNWEHTGHGYNPIYLYEKSSGSGTAMDFYNKSNGFFGGATNGVIVYGQTLHFNGSGTNIPYNTGNWLYSEIYLNSDKLTAKTNTIQQGTICHEMGHAFGLHHYDSNPNGSIMCTMSAGRKVQTVQKEDNDAINSKYGS